MKFKKSFIFGTSFLLSSAAVANSNNLFETTELGNSETINESIVASNNLNSSCDLTVLAPLELCCAYGNPRDFKKQSRKWKRAARKQKRIDRRNARK